MFKFSYFLRLILWGYVLIHTWFFWKDSIPLPIMLITLLFVEFASMLYILCLKRKKFIYNAIIAFFVITYPFLVYKLEWILNFSTIYFPFFSLYHDLWFLPLWLPLCIFFALGIIGRINTEILRFEIFLRLGVLLLLFWPTHIYKTFFYPHPNMLLISLYIYLLLEFLLLYWTNPLLALGDTKYRRNIHSFLSLTLFLLCPSLVLLCTKPFLTKSMTKNNMGLLKPTMTSFSFDNSLNLHNEVHDLSDDLLLIFKLDHVPEEKLLLKRHNFHAYNTENGFYIMKELENNVFYNNKSKQNTLNYYRHQAIIQDFYILNLDKTTLLGINNIQYTALLKPESNRKDLKHFKSYYRTVSQSLPSKNLLENNPDLFTAKHTQLLNNEQLVYLHYDNHTEIRNFALNIIGNELSPYMKAKKLENYLKKNYKYSLDPKTMGKDHSLEVLMDFLLRTKQGYCTYFAFAMALMARSLDLPARIVTGFAINPDQHILGYYPVTAKHAHAWVEIYFDNFKWITFDPTSTQFDNNLTKLEMLHDTYDPQSLYPFIEAFLEKNIQFTAEEITKIPYPVLSNTKQFFCAILIIGLLIFLCLSYLVLLIWSHYVWMPIHFLPPRKKVQLWVQKITFIWNTSNKKAITPLEFLKNSEPLVEIYRRALFSATFSQKDTQSFFKHVKQNPSIKKITRLKQFFFFFHVAWIKNRIIKNVKY